MFLAKCVNNKGHEKSLKKDRTYSVVMVIKRDNKILYALKEIPGLLFDSELFVMLTPPGDALIPKEISPINDNYELMLKAA